MKRRPLMVCAVALAIGHAGRAHAALLLDWNAPVGCASAADVVADLDRLLGAATLAHTTLRAHAQATASAQGWSIRLETDLDGVHGQRALDGPTCEAVTQAAALIVALTIDPGLEIHKASPEKPRATPPVTPAKTPPVADEPVRAASPREPPVSRAVPSSRAPATRAPATPDRAESAAHPAKPEVTINPSPAAAPAPLLPNALAPGPARPWRWHARLAGGPALLLGAVPSATAAPVFSLGATIDRGGFFLAGATLSAAYGFARHGAPPAVTPWVTSEIAMTEATLSMGPELRLARLNLRTHGLVSAQRLSGSATHVSNPGHGDATILSVGASFDAAIRLDARWAIVVAEMVELRASRPPFVIGEVAPVWRPDVALTRTALLVEREF